MEVTLFVNWDDRRIIGEAEHKEILDKNVKEMFEDDDCFNDYLDDEFCASDVYRQCQSENGKSLRESYREHCEDWVREDDCYEDLVVDI